MFLDYSWFRPSAAKHQLSFLCSETAPPAASAFRSKNLNLLLLAQTLTGGIYSPSSSLNRKTQTPTFDLMEKTSAGSSRNKRILCFLDSRWWPSSRAGGCRGNFPVRTDSFETLAVKNNGVSAPCVPSSCSTNCVMNLPQC